MANEGEQQKASTVFMYVLSYLLRSLSPQANYTDRATAACRPS
jgi:hypothetical protein